MASRFFLIGSVFRTKEFAYYYQKEEKIFLKDEKFYYNQNRIKEKKDTRGFNGFDVSAKAAP